MFGAFYFGQAYFGEGAIVLQASIITYGTLTTTIIQKTLLTSAVEAL